jgi:hypothetical protein
MSEIARSSDMVKPLSGKVARRPRDAAASRPMLPAVAD